MLNYSRLPFVFLAMICLLLGLVTGLSRIGWNIDVLSVSAHHGAIMVGGFLGTLISLEKIIPLKRKALFLIPVLSAGSVILFLLNSPLAAYLLLVVASLGLCGVFLYYLFRERNLIYLLMFGGGVCWLTGNALLIAEKFYPMAFPWWLGFTLFIITSERLELMKFLPVKRPTKQLLLIFLSLYISGVFLAFHGAGRILSGSALIAVALWLMRYDMIGVSIRKEGLPKFVATALLFGYVALTLTGIFFLALGGQAFAYDAIVHTFFIGFVFSMIFAHGPIILPGVLGVSAKPWNKSLYIWLILLHVSWVTRIAGDIIIDINLRRFSALLSLFSILCYFATVATLTVISQRRHAKVL